MNSPLERNVENEHLAIMDAVLSRDADKAVKLMHRYMIKIVHTNLTADPSTEKDADNIVSGLWSDIEVLRPGSRGDEATSKFHDGSKQQKPKPERGYFI